MRLDLEKFQAKNRTKISKSENRTKISKSENREKILSSEIGLKTTKSTNCPGKVICRGKNAIGLKKISSKKTDKNF